MYHASKCEFNMAIRDTYGVYRVSFNNGAPFQSIKYRLYFSVQFIKKVCPGKWSVCSKDVNIVATNNKEIL